MSVPKSLKQQIEEVNQSKTKWQRFKHFFLLWEGAWALPLAFFTFLLFNAIGFWIFGESFVPYDPTFWQAAIYTCGIIIGMNTVAFLGINFNFREVWRYYYCESSKDFRNLPALTKILIFLGIYFMFAASFIIVFISLV